VPLELIAPQVIPPGQLYVLGTHRDSYDSRYARVGLIKQNDVIGKAIPLF
jgi:conjugal transfer pilin signal peptidase TrbI